MISDTPNRSLAIPDAVNTPIPTGWLEQVFAPAVAEVGWDVLDDAEGRIKAIAAYLDAHDADVVGVDIRAELLLAARKRAPDRPLLLASAEALPFCDEAFDTVVSGLVFCSVPDALTGLREVHRVLGPGGRLRMLEHVRSTHPTMARWQDAIQPAWTLISGGCHPNRDTETTVAAAGFEIEAEGRRSRRNVRLFAARPR